MVARLISLEHRFLRSFSRVQQRVFQWTRPTSRSLFAGTLNDLTRTVAVTRHPTDAWVAQQLREATPFAQAPRFLIRDNDAKFGPFFARVASSSDIKMLKTPFHAPRANAYCERFLGSVRRECLDHLLILHEQQLCRALQAYGAYFNRARKLVTLIEMPRLRDTFQAEASLRNTL